MRVRFLEDYIFTPDEDRRTSVKYRAGWTGTVRSQCGEKAVAAGKAVAIPAVRRPRRKATADA